MVGEGAPLWWPGGCRDGSGISRIVFRGFRGVVLRWRGGEDGSTSLNSNQELKEPKKKRLRGGSCQVYADYKTNLKVHLGRRTPTR